LLEIVLIEGSYEHHSLEEPAILLGGSFMVDVVESAQVSAGQKDPSK
jgi:probable phosphoglycerate mutase